MLASFARPDESSPVKRGKWVRVRMLCQDLPDPPADIPRAARAAGGRLDPRALRDAHQQRRRAAAAID